MSARTPEPGVVPAPDDLLEALAIAVVVLAPEGRIRFVNAAAEDLLACSRRHLLGVRLWDAAALDPDWRLRLEGAMAERAPLIAREVWLTPLAGAPPCRIDLQATPWQSADWGDVLVLELSPLERQLRLAREEMLAAQEEASRRLLRGLAHEIRSPLGGLRGAAQLLAAEIAGGGPAEYTRVIVHEADRLGALVERMMGPARPPAMAPVNIHEVTEHVVHLLQADAGAGVAVTTDYDPSIPEAIGDRDQLIQALLNLGTNALHALDGAGRVTLRTATRRRVSIGTIPHRLVVCIEVIDDGPGVPPELHDTLFQPMVSGRAEGTGLGLTIAQSLVRRHGGLIECDSVPGETVFRILLPLPEPGAERIDGD